jgi:hypothetical protein
MSPEYAARINQKNGEFLVTVMDREIERGLAVRRFELRIRQYRRLAEYHWAF